MSNTEDYLDGLLNSMEGKATQTEPEPEMVEEEADLTADISLDDSIGAALGEEASVHTHFMSEEDEFLDAFEKEILSGDDNDEFIRQFEEELAREGMEGFSEESAMREEQFLNELGETQSDNFGMGDDIDMLSLPNDDEDIMIDTIGEDFGMPMYDMGNDEKPMEMGEEAPMEMADDPLMSMDEEPLMNMGDEPLMEMGEEPLMAMSEEPLMGMSAEMSGTDEEAGLVNDDQDLMDLLQSEGDFSDIGDMLKADEDNVALSDDGMDGFGDFSLDEMMQSVAEEEAAPEEDSKKRKKKDKNQKNNGKEASGFIQKLSQVLFGDDEDEEKKPEPVKVTPVTVAPNIEDLSDENLQILQALEGGGETTGEPQPEVETEEEAKARKKQEKKEKKEKAKAERKEKKEAAKKAKAEKAAKKPKKVKKPKEPDNTPPLPKKPVILVFVMVGSFLALVIIGTNLFGYSNSMSEAEHNYELGNYELAYKEVSGLELKESDINTFEKYRVMANVAGEFSAYQSFMEANLYDMALDSLIRTVGRCQKYQAEAELYGCTQEMTRLRTQTTGALASFGLTEEQALELYAIDDRDEYSEKVYAQITLAGFNMD